MTEFAIDIAGLKKNYGDIEAVRGIDLRVPVGEVFALLGPNGAGKTTTVEILEGHRKRTGGSVYVLGHDPENNERRFKQRIGIVLQKTGVEPYLNVEETIKLFNASSIKDMGKIMGALKKKYAGTIDFSKVNVIVKNILEK